jgi:hypothetical protein
MMAVSQQTLDSISTPAQVNTPLGTLQLPLGVPTDETQRLAYDHLDHVDRPHPAGGITSTGEDMSPCSAAP